MQTEHLSNVRYVPQLTGIRAIAALLVLGLHTTQNVAAEPFASLPFLTRGYLGVDFFFVLSGFIITHVYLARLATPDGRSILIFLWHRLIRLYPVHLAMLVCLIVLVTLAQAAGVRLNDPDGWRFADIPWQLTMLHAWGATPSAGWNAPSWSISAEWFAYLLFPLLAPALARVRSIGEAFSIAAAALVVLALLFAAFGWTLNAWVGAPALIRVSGEFLCGAALCRAVSLSWQSSRLSGDWLGAGAFAAFVLGASVGVADFGLVALLALGIFGAATARGFLASVLGGRPMVWLGDISYSIYMAHFPILLVVRRFWQYLSFSEWGAVGQSLAFLATVALVIAISAILFYGVERPARARLRDRMGRLASA